MFARHTTIPSRRRPHTTPLRAFTLVELIVSIGILGILMVMAGSIFALTLKSSGQANALIEVSESIRALEDSLREDLRYVQPSRSIMLIQGNEMNVFWTEDERELADPGNDDATVRYTRNRDPERERIDASGNLVHTLPRGDKVMFFTAKPGVSFTDPRVSGRLQMVVYGHATVGEMNVDGSFTAIEGFAEDGSSALNKDNLRFGGLDATTGMPTYAMMPADNSTPPDWRSVAPAETWLLGRRSVLIVDQNLAAAASAEPYYPADALDDDADEVAAVAGADPEYDNRIPKDGYILDGRRDYIINGGSFNYQRDVVNLLPDPTYDCNDDNPGALIRLIKPSLVDPTPPYTQSKRLGHYFLPNCASFKVEWALDVSDVDYGPLRGTNLPGASSIIWIDPAHFAQNVADIQSAFQQYYVDECAGDIICQGQVRSVWISVISKLVPADPSMSIPASVDCETNMNGPDFYEMCLGAHTPTRFADPGPTGGADLTVLPAHIFYARNPAPSCAGNFAPGRGACAPPPEQPDALFPKALRITVDVNDPAGRLDKPIRHVMVLPVGRG